MHIYPDIWDVHTLVQSWHRQGDKIGFIPTMGNLHKGHLRLVDVARKYAERIVVSIYVNPLQFGANEDLANYPRTIEQDIEQLHEQIAALSQKVDELQKE